MDTSDGKWFDIWMVPHFVGWLIITAWLTWFFAGALTLPLAVAAVVVGSAAWELVEMARERILGYRMEPWTNRFIVDPITNVLGGVSGWLLYNLL